MPILPFFSSARFPKPIRFAIDELRLDELDLKLRKDALDTDETLRAAFIPVKELLPLVPLVPLSAAAPVVSLSVPSSAASSSFSKTLLTTSSMRDTCSFTWSMTHSNSVEYIVRASPSRRARHSFKFLTFSKVSFLMRSVLTRNAFSKSAIRTPKILSFSPTSGSVASAAAALPFLPLALVFALALAFGLGFEAVLAEALLLVAPPWLSTYVSKFIFPSSRMPKSRWLKLFCVSSEIPRVAIAWEITFHGVTAFLVFARLRKR
mmetsp:Transcript_17991/g.33233  ORF Transcript_17991/g.33233 Transcript_17991/m.33233 type:complete len:263 (-) Transcript_17991:883-1671(-)